LTLVLSVAVAYALNIVCRLFPRDATASISVRRNLRLYGTTFFFPAFVPSRCGVILARPIMPGVAQFVQAHQHGSASLTIPSNAELHSLLTCHPDIIWTRSSTWCRASWSPARSEIIAIETP